jgi:hypothetical protein
MFPLLLSWHGEAKEEEKEFTSPSEPSSLWSIHQKLMSSSLVSKRLLASSSVGSQFLSSWDVVRCECLIHLGTWSPGVRLHFTVSAEGWDKDFFVFFLYLLSRVGHPGPRNVQFLKNIRDFPLLHLYLFSLTTRPPNHGCPLVIIEFIMNRWRENY